MTGIMQSIYHSIRAAVDSVKEKNESISKVSFDIFFLSAVNILLFLSAVDILLFWFISGYYFLSFFLNFGANTNNVIIEIEIIIIQCYTLFFYFLQVCFESYARRLIESTNTRQNFGRRFGVNETHLRTSPTSYFYVKLIKIIHACLRS